MPEKRESRFARVRKSVVNMLSPTRLLIGSKDELLPTVAKPEWRLHKPIVEGGFSVVYTGHSVTTELPAEDEPGLDGRVAIKVCQVQVKKPNKDEERPRLNQAEPIDRLREEVQVLQSLADYTHVVQLYEAFHLKTKQENEVWMVFEYIQVSLFDVVLRRFIKHDEMRAVTYGIINAMNYLHSQGIIHKDIKVENILLTTDGHAKLCDFGLAVVLPEDTEELVVDSVEGTIATMAPELMHSGRKYDKYVDWWAFGVTLEFMAERKYGRFEDEEFISSCEEVFEYDETLYFIKLFKYINNRNFTPEKKDFLVDHGYKAMDVDNMRYRSDMRFDLKSFIAACVCPVEERRKRTAKEKLVENYFYGRFFEENSDLNALYTKVICGMHEKQLKKKSPSDFDYFPE